MLAPGFDLPQRPRHLADTLVATWAAPVTIPAYLPEAPGRYPARDLIDQLEAARSPQ